LQGTGIAIAAGRMSRVASRDCDHPVVAMMSVKALLCLGRIRSRSR